MRNGLDASTLASKVYESVRRGILSGDLKPGQPMSRRRIATELCTSPLPVASAFQRLELEGFLESRPRAGTRVRALSLDEIRGHFVVREALETQAATRVALLADDQAMRTPTLLLLAQHRSAATLPAEGKADLGGGEIRVEEIQNLLDEFRQNDLIDVAFSGDGRTLLTLGRRATRALLSDVPEAAGAAR